jgi:uncharacterized protein with beta-barrel porin domain
LVQATSSWRRVFDGATPQHNSVAVGLQATTSIAAAAQIYLRYDGEIASGTDNHALNVGVRLSW